MIGGGSLEPTFTQNDATSPVSQRHVNPFEKVDEVVGILHLWRASAAEHLDSGSALFLRL